MVEKEVSKAAPFMSVSWNPLDSCCGWQVAGVEAEERRPLSGEIVQRPSKGVEGVVMASSYFPLSNQRHIFLTCGKEPKQIFVLSSF